MGAAIGRYANRIKNASFKIDDKEFPVAKNWDADQLHGGFEGFDKKVWDFVSFDEQCNILQLKYNSPDGEEGFPGNLEVNICFELNDENDLIYEYSATCDQATAINLTHHGYFNLNNGEGTIDDHEIKIYSDKILEQDKNLVVNGNYISVENTKYDFTDFHKIAERMNGGYDQSFVVDKKDNQLSIVAEALSKKTGIEITGTDNRATWFIFIRARGSQRSGEKIISNTDLIQDSVWKHKSIPTQSILLNSQIPS